MTGKAPLFDLVRKHQPLVIAGLSAAYLLAMSWRLMATDGGALRFHLMRAQFWALETQFALFVALTCLTLPSFIRSIDLRTPAIIMVACASLLAFGLMAGAVPQTNRIYYDEHIYQGIAQNLADLHVAQMCNEGTVEYGQLQCARGEYNKQPYGFPYVLSVLYRIGGAHESIAHWFNMACAVLMVWVVFLTVSALWRDRYAAAFSAFVAALLPQHLLWSRTAAAEPSAALMIAIAVMTSVHFVQARTVRSLLWMVAATVFAVQFRPESLLVVALVACVVGLYAHDAFRGRSFWWAVLLGVVLCTAYVEHLAAVRGEAWGAPGERMALSFFWPNLRVNGMFFLNNARFPVFVTIVALWGLASRPGRAALVAAVYFLAFWGVFLFFYAGSYNYGADVRFSLMSYPAVAMLAGVGASSLHARAVKVGFEARRAASAIGAALAFQFLSFMPQVRAIGEEAWAARADIAFAQRVAHDLPANSIVLTHNPAVFHLRGINAAQMSLALADPDYVTSVLPSRYAGGVFLHWNYWCNVEDAAPRALCKKVLDQLPGEVFREYREREYRYGFYRLDTGSPRLLLKTSTLSP